MKTGKIEIGNYTIEPNTKKDIFISEDFNKINSNNMEVLISKRPFEIYDVEFWVHVYYDEKVIKKIVLHNADKKYKINYQTMNSLVIQELRRENDKFLLDILGNPTAYKLSGLEYSYSWGKILSYYDNKSSDAGVVIIYN